MRICVTVRHVFFTSKIWLIPPEPERFLASYTFKNIYRAVVVTLKSLEP